MNQSLRITIMYANVLDNMLLFQFQIKALSSLARLRLLSILVVCNRCLSPRRLDITLDEEPE